MIQALLRVPLAALLVLGIACAVGLVQGGDPAEVVAGERVRLRAALGEEAFAAMIGASTATNASIPLLDRLPSEVSRTLQAGIKVSELRIATLLRILPFSAALLLAGGLAGAVFRERIRHARGYASPAAAFLARALVCGALLLGILFGLSWIPLPYWVPYVASAAACVGACLYVSNLPIRL